MATTAMAVTEGMAVMAATTTSHGAYKGKGPGFREEPRARYRADVHIPTTKRGHDMQTRKTNHYIIRAGLAALLLAVAMPLAAHEGELGSTPEDGSTVQGSPEQIGIEFDGVMRITEFDVTGPDGRVRLTNRPGNEPTERYFVEPAEPLPAGDYQVRWRGLARDGHMMSDGFRFTVED